MIFFLSTLMTKVIKNDKQTKQGGSMKIECTVEELKELIKKETPVEGTTDVSVKLNGKEITSVLEKY